MPRFGVQTIGWLALAAILILAPHALTLSQQEVLVLLGMYLEAERDQASPSQPEAGENAATERGGSAPASRIRFPAVEGDR